MTTNNNLGIHSYISNLPIAMQQSIILDLVQADIMGEDLDTASRSRLCDLAATINITPYIAELGCAVLSNKGRVKGRFFISDKANMNTNQLEDLTTIKYALDTDHHFNIEIYHDVYEFGKYYMMLLHFYKNEPVLEYDDDIETVVTSVDTTVERSSVYFNHSEVTIGLMGQQQFSFGFDNEVTHYLDVHSCAEYDEHMIFAVHKYADIETEELINKITNVFEKSFNK